MKTEFLNAYLSNVVLDEDHFNPYRMLTLQVKVNYEPQQNLLEQTEDDAIANLTAAVEQGLRQINFSAGSQVEQLTKYKIEITPADNADHQFGWYKL